MKNLTDRQKQAFDFIRDFMRRNDRAPTTREICAAMGIASPFGARRHLEALEKKGYIERDALTARGIRLAPQFRETGGIALVGRVAAGTPITALENIDGYYSLRNIFGDPERLFLLEVKGDSMVGAGINDGDYVVVRKQSRVENGEIGVAVVNEEATVKRIWVKGGRIKLVAENPAYKPMEFAESDDVLIAGKVTGVVRKL